MPENQKHPYVAPIVQVNHKDETPVGGTYNYSPEADSAVLVATSVTIPANLGARGPEAVAEYLRLLFSAVSMENPVLRFQATVQPLPTSAKG